MRVSITYETITEDSAREGDFEDHGWIHPTTEARRTCRSPARLRERNIRMARKGTFDWTLRAALEFLQKNTSTERNPREGQVDDRLQIRGFGEYDPSEVEQQVNYTVHIEDCSTGTLARLTEVFRNNGVYFG